MRKWIFAVALMLCAGAAFAEDTTQYPIFAVERLTIGARVTHDWYSGQPDGPADYFTDQLQKEFHVGAVGAYSMTGGNYPTSLIGGTTYGLDSKLLHSWVGLNLRLFSGRPD